jgi:hypothetical protein
MAIDTDVETPDVPMTPTESDGGTVGSQGSKRPFVEPVFKDGGKVDLSKCKVSTHEKCKSSPNW